MVKMAIPAWRPRLDCPPASCGNPSWWNLVQGQEHWKGCIMGQKEYGQWAAVAELPLTGLEQSKAEPFCELYIDR